MWLYDGTCNYILYHGTAILIILKLYYGYWRRSRWNIYHGRMQNSNHIICLCNILHQMYYIVYNTMTKAWYTKYRIWIQVVLLIYTIPSASAIIYALLYYNVPYHLRSLLGIREVIFEYSRSFIGKFSHTSPSRLPTRPSDRSQPMDVINVMEGETTYKRGNYRSS